VLYPPNCTEFASSPLFRGCVSLRRPSHPLRTISKHRPCSLPSWGSSTSVIVMAWPVGSTTQHVTVLEDNLVTVDDEQIVPVAPTTGSSSAVAYSIRSGALEELSPNRTCSSLTTPATKPLPSAPELNKTSSRENPSAATSPLHQPSLISSSPQPRPSISGEAFEPPLPVVPEEAGEQGAAPEPTAATAHNSHGQESISAYQGLQLLNPNS
jgi:hypothetical protein